MKGLVHIYCGDGKGKTTAAIGSAVRAAGRGRRVLVCRFLKTDDSGEVMGLSDVPGITVLPCTRSFGFSWEMTPEQKQEAALYFMDRFLRAWEMAGGREGEGGCDMVVLDEIIGACNLGFVKEEEVVKAIRTRPEHMEVILTGRNPSKPLVECGDYITEMVMRRHPFTDGTGAREGIEY